MKRLLGSLLFLCLSGLPHASHASLVSFDFTATLLSGTPGSRPLSATAASFASISGTFSFDTAAGTQFSFPTQASYLTGAIKVNQFDVSVAHLSAPSFTATVANDSDSLGDYFQLYSGGARSGLADGDYDLISLALTDFIPPYDALSSILLPTSLDLSRFGSASLSFQGFHMSGGGSSFLGSTDFHITAITPHVDVDPAPAPDPQAVPEPASLALVGVALTGLAFARRQARQR